ncbi:hypothetical protein C3B44_02670 [Corynebacterium yudongzhengii]|uniref:Uncharacterized protein n=1 Tax=Corynebacterium yudongzhengii TaxID=2080740 RepID=A0A2U1T753_9CORY|nr:hypothetical protein [Corynebacterium yudongzhengii]AWB81391.1 hypothetical protein C3B44_02670 [Corynebacterium yudongzhengii]PWC01834.1 hypothetical protein DF222_05755 [Corynebacterium yudongzhengii]
MTHPSDYDPEAVRFFDLAHEGAQIRSVAQIVDKLAPLAGNRPRSVIIYSPDHLARKSAELAVALAGPLNTPCVIVDKLPSYTGPLDVVVALTDRGDAPELARGLITAAGRGAEIICAPPARGPLLDDLPPTAFTVPALPTVAGFSPARVIATVTAVLDVLAGPDVPVAERISELAASIDEDIVRLSPERDATINPARGVRAFVDKHQVIHTAPPAGDPEHETGARAAELIAHLWSARGMASGYVDPADLPEVLNHNVTANTKDIFHDPYLDGPEEVIPLRILVWAARETDLTEAMAISADQATRRPFGRIDAALRLVIRALAATIYDAPTGDGA